MADKVPSFSERRERMFLLDRQLEREARELDRISTEIVAEAERMAAAEKRFSQRRGRDSKKASR